MKHARLLLLALAVPILASCAYWNTFYLARKNYDKGTAGQPYLTDPGDASSGQYFVNSIKYSKKVLSQYPTSKLVPEAYLLWARALICRQDPLEAVNMLTNFPTRYPKSPLKADATFYLGVAYRQAHKPNQALDAFDDFLKTNPKHEMVPYALLERARALTSLDRKREAAETAGKLVAKYPKGALERTARLVRADALFDEGDFAAAREDYHVLGVEAANDDDRFTYLLREADCLQGARDYDGEIALMHNALTHEITPVVTTQTTPSGTIPVAPSGPGTDRWGRLRLRIGGAQVLAGRLDPAIQEYHEVLDSYPRTVLAAEAQYRIAYAYETLAEDFDKARLEYRKVKDASTLGGFAVQADTRLANLDRLTAFGRASGRDSLERKAKAGFLLAELYLFQHNRPDRALEQYRKIEHDYEGTAWAGKAINAQAWLLSRKMDRKAEADSLFWRVVHEYRATEAQLAARDYLEAEGFTVADSLIEAPRELIPVLKAEPDTVKLTPPPATTQRLGRGGQGIGRAALDSLNRANARVMQGMPGADAAGDSLHPVYPPPRFQAPDTSHTAPAPPAAPAPAPPAADTSHAAPAVPAPRDTTGKKP